MPAVVSFNIQREKRSRSKKIKCHIQKLNTLENNNVPYSHYKIIPHKCD